MGGRTLQASRVAAAAIPVADGAKAKLRERRCASDVGTGPTLHGIHPCHRMTLAMFEQRMTAA
jgi:hypothetical protein